MTVRPLGMITLTVILVRGESIEDYEKRLVTSAASGTRNLREIKESG